MLKIKVSQCNLNITPWPGMWKVCLEFLELMVSPLLQYPQAVKCYEEGCASILLEHGANLNIANAKGDTALHLSVFHPKSSLTAKLLSHGADAEAKNKV